MSIFKLSFGKSRALMFCTVSAISLCAFPLTQSYANPEGGQVVGGQATITQDGTKLDITQHTDKAVIDWRSFNIAPDEHTQFHQPSSDSISLNRVTGTDPSAIAGKLSANGNVILINPNGVFFSAGSQVDVNGIVVSTSDIDSQDFMSSDTARLRGETSRADAKIINDGMITAKEAGLVGLVAPHVENNGTITATLGNVHLAGADTAVIDFYGDGLTGVEVTGNAAKAIISHTGTINAQGGNITLSAAAGREIVDNLITVKGELHAPSISQKNGKIVISAQSLSPSQDNGYKASAVEINAKLDVDNQGADGHAKAGTITVAADQIILRDNANLSASGQHGGGEILIGGDLQGQGDAQKALVTSIAQGAKINADAKHSGDGGKVIVWADQDTYFYGDISAQGGSFVGDGGFVEVSGKNYLDFDGIVDTQALNGQSGTLLLDPANIVIQNGSGDGAADGVATFKGASTVGTIAAANASPSILYESELQGIAASTNISIAASNSIILNDLADGVLSLKQVAGKSVTFTAGAGGFVMQDLTDTISTAGGALRFTTTAGGASSLGNISTNGGLLTIDTNGNSTISGVISGAGGLTKAGTGILTLSGDNTYSGTTSLSAGTAIAGTDQAFGTGTLTIGSASLRAGSAPRVIGNTLNITGNAVINGTSDLTLTGNVLGLAANRTLTVNNTGNTTLAGTVNLSNSATNRSLTMTGTGNTTISGVIQNGSTSTASALIKTGTGTLTLSGNNTYGGTTTLTTGTIVAASDSALGTGALAFNGGTLRSNGLPRSLANTITFSSNGVIAGASDLTLTGNVAGLSANRTLTVNNTGNTTLAGTVNLSNSATSRSLTITGTGNTTISGVVQNGSTSTASLLAKSGTGTLTLSGANTYGGITSITGGTIAAAHSSAFGTGAISLNGGTIRASGGAQTLGNAIVLAGNGAISGSENLSLNGTLTVSNGNRVLTNNNTADTTLNGVVNLSNNSTSRALTIAGAGNTIINGVIQNGSTSTGGVLIKSGTGTLTLFGNNTYGGATTVSQGTLKLGAAERISNTSSGVTVSSGATFNMNGFNETLKAITVNGALNMGSGATLTTTGSQALTGAVTGHNATLISTAAGTITANNVNNNFTGNLALTTTNTASIANAGDLKLGTINAKTFSANAINGSLTLDGKITASNTSGNSIILHGKTDFINNFGATALKTSGTARWLVFENDAADGMRGGLVSHNRYGCSYNAGAASCVSGVSAPTTGNTFFYAQRPVLTITGIDVADKTYDATTSASLTGTASLSGVLNGDAQSFASTNVTAQFADKHAGANKATIISGYSLTGTNLGYLLAQPSTVSATIAPRAVALTKIVAADKRYDGSTRAVLSNLEYSAPISGDDFSVQNAHGSFDTALAGLNKRVTFSGAVRSGADAKNYVLDSAGVQTFASIKNVPASQLPKAAFAVNLKSGHSTKTGGAFALRDIGTKSGSGIIGHNSGAGGFSDPATQSSLSGLVSMSDELVADPSGL